ncbi:MAG TPA: heavy metal-associated domain-containing protein, partial [Kineosporiaceae bacterium]|nr:heavy metal-associated domain-containing protein [Kineosporiaceae bacterium]
MPSSRAEPGTTPVTAPADPAGEVRSLDLAVGGMTCSSCAARIEKKLNRMPGVQASVNYATESAHVTFPAELDPAELVATVERTGYTARLPAPRPAPGPGPGPAAASPDRNP